MNTHANLGNRGDDEYVGVMGLLTPWDMSRNPNRGDDLLRKLGGAGKTRAAAIIGFHTNSGRKQWADGLTNEKRLAQSVGSLDPDNWVLRVYGEALDTGEYAVWSHRLVADHMGLSAAREMRSTQVVDAASDQAWAWLSDQFRVVTPNGGTPVLDEYLKYDGAGFAPWLYEEVTTGGKPYRGALAATLHRNLGFVAAGANVGQWAHIFTFPSPAPADVATTSKGSGPIRLPGKGGTDSMYQEPPIPQSPAGRPESPAELMLRWDAKWRHSSGPVRWPGLVNMPKEGPDSGEVRRVFLARDKNGPVEDLGLDVPNDPQSNHAKIPKDAVPATLAWYVKVPPPGYGGDTHHYDYSYHSDPPPEDESSSGGSDVATGGASTPGSSGGNPDESDPLEDDTEGVDPATGEYDGYVDDRTRRMASAAEAGARTAAATGGWGR